VFEGDANKNQHTKEEDKHKDSNSQQDDFQSALLQPMRRGGHLIKYSSIGHFSIMSQ
jgi:hypothetical protein